jgi:hypothetical protein
VAIRVDDEGTYYPSPNLLVGRARYGADFQLARHPVPIRVVRLRRDRLAQWLDRPCTKLKVWKRERSPKANLEVAYGLLRSGSGRPSRSAHTPLPVNEIPMGRCRGFGGYH